MWGCRTGRHRPGRDAGPGLGGGSGGDASNVPGPCRMVLFPAAAGCGVGGGVGLALGIKQGYGGGMLDTAGVDTEGCQRGVVLGVVVVHRLARRWERAQGRVRGAAMVFGDAMPVRCFDGGMPITDGSDGSGPGGGAVAAGGFDSAGVSHGFAGAVDGAAITSDAPGLRAAPLRPQLPAGPVSGKSERGLQRGSARRWWRRRKRCSRASFIPA